MSDATSGPTTESRHERKVITVTLNPSLDRTLTTHFLAVGYHNRATDTTRLDAAGRGMNVSRAMNKLGVSTHAVVLLGVDATGRAYEALLTEEQFPITILRRSGRTRSNIVVKDTGHSNETVILEDSDGVTPNDIRMVGDVLLQLINPGDTVVFAGSLPGDLRTDTYAGLTSLAQTAGGAVAINAGGGEPLQQALQARPTLLYLTQTQLEGLFNFPVRAYEDVIYCAQQLQAQGARRILVAMPSKMDALFVAEEGMWMVDLPEIELGTSSGQAEAMVAGYLAARLNGQSLDEAIGLAAAAAAYTAARVGNEFGTLQEISENMENIGIFRFESVDELPLADLDEDAAAGAAGAEVD